MTCPGIRWQLNSELLKVKFSQDRSNLTVRNIFVIEFDDGSRREEYHKFLLLGENGIEDLDCLLRNDFKPSNGIEPYPEITGKLELFVQNQKALIKSRYEGVVNIRHKCVGIQTFK